MKRELFHAMAKSHLRKSRRGEDWSGAIAEENVPDLEQIWKSFSKLTDIALARE